MEKIENNGIIILKSEKISDLEKQKIFENSISSDELKKRLDKKNEIEAQKLRKNLEKNSLFEDEEKIYSEEEMKKITYDFIDNQTELLKKEYFYIKLSPI